MTYDQIIATLFPGGAPVDFKAYALILDAQAVISMQSAQNAVGSSRHKVEPVPTTDGRWLMCADILTELNDNGIFSPALPYFDATYLSGVQVIPWSDRLDLLPSDGGEAPI